MAFLAVERLHRPELLDAYLTAPARLVSEFLGANLPPDTVLGAQECWNSARELLDRIEDSIKSKLEHRHVAYWKHIYRRIGLSLAGQTSNTDPRTIALVRQIVEIAIEKYGQLGVGDELVLSSRIAPERILGGWFKSAFRTMEVDRPSKAYRTAAAGLRTVANIVIRDFSEADLIAIYGAEGLAYQYWRVTALMRSLGKGARIRIANGNWRYVDDPELEALLASIDRRTDGGTVSSSAGLWFASQNAEFNPSTKTRYIIFTSYNVTNVPVGDLLSDIAVSPRYAGNFALSFVDAAHFAKVHEVVEPTFTQHNGYALDTFVDVLWAVCFVAYVPDHVMLDDHEKSRKVERARILMSFVQRGYRYMPTTRDELVQAIKRRTQVRPDGPVPEQEIETVLDRLILSAANQANAGLWTRGPSRPLIPTSNGYLLDAQGLLPLLATLFVGVNHNQSARGTVFEQMFRESLTELDMVVHSGELRNAEGTRRELDAAIVIGTTLVIFECVSVQRPLDYEIGRPQTFEFRKRRLQEKLEQAASLQRFLEQFPTGRNYDFSKATSLVSFVVSPFEEWIWSLDESLWYAGKRPRILSVEEALDMVRSSSVPT